MKHPKMFFASCRRLLRISIGVLVWIMLTSPLVFGQQNGKLISLKLDKVTVLDAIKEINRLSGNSVSYKREELEKEARQVSLDLKNVSVGKAVGTVLQGTRLVAIAQGEIILIVLRKDNTDAKKSVRIKGFVYDKQKQSMPGVTVKVVGLTLGTSTNAQGWFALELPMLKGALELSFVGFKKKTIDFSEKTAQDTLRIVMEEDTQELEETVVVAFGSQKRESVVSAITTVRAEELKSSNSDLTASFAGKIAGIVGWQTGGLPGALTEEEMNTKFYVRGITSFQSGANIDPLILLDGVESSKLDLARIDPEDIESFSVMKDASATAMYGARGANGVILVTTKKGKEGSVYTSVRYEAVASMPTREIDVVDPVTYMKAYNEALMSRNPLATPKYTAEDINRRGSKKFPSWVYPANDWYDVLFKRMNVNHHMGVNIRGGSRVIQYYASLNHNRDAGMLKTDRLNQFDVNIKNNSTTFRVNLTVDLAAGIQLLMNSSSSIDKYHGPLYDVSAAYQLAFNANPVDFAPTYPADDKYNWPHIRFGGKNVEENPYALIQMGYKERSRFSTINRVEYIQNLSSLIKGLELRANVSYSQQGYYSIPYSTSPYVYTLKSYRDDTGVHELTAWNPTKGSRILSLNGTSKDITGSTRLTGEIRLMHTAAWKDHSTTYTAVFQAQEYSDSSPTTVQSGIPNRNLGLSMRMAYGYKNRYFLEGSFGYNGSERFAKHNRMGFFPAVGGAWLVSSENFMQRVSNWLPLLKLRVSYGQVGNDGVIDTPRFVYIQDISDYEYQWSPMPGQSKSNAYRVNAYENPDITWEIAEQVNFGLETKLFRNGLVDITLDAYQEVRHNVLSNRVVIPAALGLGHYPLANVGKVRSRGIDFAGKLQHAFSSDLWVILNGTLTYNKATFLEIEQAADKPAWQNKIGKDISQAVGYIAEGLFRDQEEINNAPVQGGNVMPGDIRYRDLNGDNVIDVEDATYIGYPETPRLIYGFNGFINYKGFEFSFAFQGSGQRSLFMDPAALSPFYGNHALLQAIYDDHWSTDNMADRPLWPRLSTHNLIEHNPQEDRTSDQETTRKSTYFMREVKFLRCRSIELAYNLPKSLAKRLYVKNLKVFARTNNPFMISNFKLWDVELGSNGFNYPIQKTYSLGVNISF